MIDGFCCVLGLSLLFLWSTSVVNYLALPEKKMYSPCWGYRLFWSWPPSPWNVSLISSTGRRVFSWKSQFLRSSKIKDNFFFFLIFSHCYDYNPAIQPRCNVVLGVISNESKEDDINRMLDVLTKVSQRVI